MNSNDYQHSKQVYLEARDMPANEREKYVRERLSDREDLAKMVMLMLLKDGPVAIHVNEGEQLVDVREGERFGAYTLVHRLGEGGMGTVYLAVETGGTRTVAIKVAQNKAGSPSLPARFEQEIETLRSLDHPGIARFVDDGSVETRDGPRRYYVMDHVSGNTLLKYAAGKQLSTVLRLELFVEVLAAVEYAHEKGVIHRDLKPDNIMVDESGHAVVVDFGVARVMGKEGAVSGVNTQDGDMVGSVWYMSPEQASGKSSEVDERSDVYTLGVVLYELLAGCLPYEVVREGRETVWRRIRHEPPRPLGDAVPGIAVDLETIVEKALMKEPAARYATARAMGEDLRRFLRTEPIQARPPSAWYNLTRFVVRNKRIAAVFAIVFLSLGIGLGMAVWGMSRARRSAEEAKQAGERLSEALAREKQRYWDLFDVGAVWLKMMDPERLHERLGGDHDAETIAAAIDEGIIEPSLRWAAESAKNEVSFNPQVHAVVVSSAADAYWKLHLTKKAEGLLRQAIQIWESDMESPTRAGDVAAARGSLANVLKDQGRISEAEREIASAVVVLRGEQDPRWLTDRVATLNIHAATLIELRRFVEAEAPCGEAITILGAASKTDGILYARTLSTLGSGLFYRSRFDDSEAVLQEAVRLFESDKEIARGIPAIEAKVGLARSLVRTNGMNQALLLLAESMESLNNPMTPIRLFDSTMLGVVEYSESKANTEPWDNHQENAAFFRTLLDWARETRKKK